MFTGLIEAVCSLTQVFRTSNALRLSIDLGTLAENAKPGDSIAINGTCLTITSIAASTATFDASPETLARSTLGKLTTGSSVNVERAMQAKDRFGGHFVLGHVDGVAKIKTITNRGDFWDISF